MRYIFVLWDFIYGTVSFYNVCMYFCSRHLFYLEIKISAIDTLHLFSNFKICFQYIYHFTLFYDATHEEDNYTGAFRAALF